MKLTQKHREALIERFKKAISDNEMTVTLMNNCDPHLKPTYEIQDFIETQEINLIQQSLIDNNIDY